MSMSETSTGRETSDRIALGVSYFYRPWSTYRYLEDAFRSFCEVRYFGTSYKNRPGYAPDHNILDSVEKAGADLAGFVSTEDCLFEAITRMECPTAIWIGDYWPGYYHSLRYARLFDHVFMSQRDWLGDFSAAGCKQVHWLPFACDPQIHRDHQLERKYDVGFVGHVNLASQLERLRLLTELSQRYHMNDFSTPAYLDEMAKVYSQSKIVVNMGYRGNFNMRVFEAMSCGALLLTEDTGNGQRELFSPGVHLDIYRDKTELFHKIDYYLAHEDERKGIAEAGQREVLTRHRYTDRARTITNVIQHHPLQRGRATDRDEILRIYALFHSRRRRVDLLLKSFARSRCSISTRMYIGARLLKSMENTLRA